MVIKKKINDFQSAVFGYEYDNGSNYKCSQYEYCVNYTRIGCSNYFPPIHLQPFYIDRFEYKKGDFPVTESVSERTIALPFFNNLEEDKIDYVVKALKKEISKIKEVM